MSPEFNAIAHSYDATFSQTAVGRLQRERVWHFTSRFFQRESAEKATGNLLELNCGTGEDAIWLANLGFQVLATDSSPEMLSVAKAKIERAGLTAKAQVALCPFAEVAHLPEGNFDLIFSNFGGLNCVSPEALGKLGPIFAQKLQPGGKFIAVVMSRFSWWETLYFFLKKQPRKAFRRLQSNPVEARLDAQTTIQTWYYSPMEFQKRLQFRGKCLFVKPIGLWLPPSYLDPFFEKHPRWLEFLNFLERNCAPTWLAGAGDHFYVCLERAEEKDSPL